MYVIVKNKNTKSEKKKVDSKSLVGFHVPLFSDEFVNEIFKISV